MRAMASQITSLTIVYSTVYSGADGRKHKRSVSLAFVRGIHRYPVNSPHKRPVTRKMFPFMTSSWMSNYMITWQNDTHNVVESLYDSVIFVKKRTTDTSLFSREGKRWGTFWEETRRHVYSACVWAGNHERNIIKYVEVISDSNIHQFVDPDRLFLLTWNIENYTTSMSYSFSIPIKFSDQQVHVLRSNGSPFAKEGQCLTSG